MESESESERKMIKGEHARAYTLKVGCAFSFSCTCVFARGAAISLKMSCWTWQGDVIWDMQQMQEVIETQIQVKRERRREGGRDRGR